MNMNEAPQSAARRKKDGRKCLLIRRRLAVADPSPATVRLDSLTRVSEQSLHRALGLTDGEHARICELLERDPNHFELAVFSLLWSEHCGYKHSARLLRRLPSSGERVLQGPGRTRA